MTGNIASQMTSGIYNTQEVVVVLITKKNSVEKEGCGD
jgi:hypothetical protein